jgi:hypothetical protein
MISFVKYSSAEETCKERLMQRKREADATDANTQHVLAAFLAVSLGRVFGFSSRQEISSLSRESV